MEEERNACKQMCQPCPYMMQGMYMNPSMMYQQQMQQPMGYPGMMGQMGYPTGRDEEEDVSTEAGYRQSRPYYPYYPSYPYYPYYPSYPYYPYYPYHHGYHHGYYHHHR